MKKLAILALLICGASLLLSSCDKSVEAIQPEEAALPVEASAAAQIDNVITGGMTDRWISKGQYGEIHYQTYTITAQYPVASDVTVQVMLEKENYDNGGGDYTRISRYPVIRVGQRTASFEYESYYWMSGVETFTIDVIGGYLFSPTAGDATYKYIVRI